MSLYHYGLVVTDAASGVWLSLRDAVPGDAELIRHFGRLVLLGTVYHYGMDRLLCSVWSNGKTGWGLKVLGGTEVRRRYFDRSHAKIALELDGIEVLVNIAKKSF